MNEMQNSLRVPCWCPLCSYPMKGKSTSTWYAWQVCITCFIFFIEDREERWKSGWRPSEQEMKSYIDSLSSDVS